MSRTIKCIFVGLAFLVLLLEPRTGWLAECVVIIRDMLQAMLVDGFSA